MADDELGSDDEVRERARQILGNDFDISPPDEGMEVFMYDWYLKLKRAGFSEKQALWLIVDMIFGQHVDLGITNGEEETPTS